MKKRLSGATALALLIAAVGLQWNWDRLVGVRGDLAARYDIARGRMRLLDYGEGRDEPILQELLRNRHQIELRRVAGCVVSEPLMEYVLRYNARIMAYSDDRFGRDWLEQAQDDALWIEAESATPDLPRWQPNDPNPPPKWLPQMVGHAKSRDPRSIPEGLR